MLFPGKDYRRPPADAVVAAEDVRSLAAQAPSLLAAANGVEWYREHGSAVDAAALALCRLRRARAGELGGQRAGDEAVRAALGEADPEAVIWLASRAISYMDENGFPEAVGPYFGA